MLTEDEFNGIEDLIEKNKSNLENVRILMINHSRCLRLYRGKISRPNINKMISELSLDRGNILDIVTKLEFLVNEIIQNKVVGYDLHRSYLLDAILENIPFATKLGLLKEWGLFDIFAKDKDSSFHKIKNIMNVRNDLAHQWTENEALYQRKALTEEVFEKFRTDLDSAWKIMVEVYSEEQQDKITKYAYEIDKGNYNSFLAFTSPENGPKNDSIL